MNAEIANRKKELQESLLTSVKGYLASTRGANLFGANSEAYHAKSNDICIKTSDGEVYWVKVQKSGWRWK